MTNTIGIGAFTPADARDIKRKVLNTDKVIPKPFMYPEKDKLGWHYGILKETLLPATNPLTGYTQAQFAVLMYVTGRDTLDMEEVEGEHLYYTLTNRSPFISGEVGDVVLVRWVVKEWVPIWAAGSTLRYGIVSASHGCGHYTVELGVWSGDIDTAGVGIGSDTSSGLPDINCDVCWDKTGEGTSECAITISYPPCPVTGTGEFVEAHHNASALVPLKVGTACVLTGGSSNSASSSSSTTASSSASTAPWKIVDGLQEHIVEYKEVWDCCDGPGESGEETLISRTPVIFAGKECDPLDCGTCVVESSSS